MWNRDITVSFGLCLLCMSISIDRALVLYSFVQYIVSVQEVSKKCPGSVQEVSRKCPGSVQEVSRECPRNVQEVSRECPGSVQ